MSRHYEKGMFGLCHYILLCSYNGVNGVIGIIFIGFDDTKSRRYQNYIFNLDLSLFTLCFFRRV